MIFSNALGRSYVAQLGEVCPSSALPNSMDGSKVNLVVDSDESGRPWVCNYRRDLFVGEFGVRVLLSLRRSTSFLAIHVLNVLGLSAQKQVRWIHTAWSVAAVADALAIRDGATKKNPRQSVGASGISFNGDDPIAILVDTGRPQPATRKVWEFAHFIKKQIQCWTLWLCQISASNRAEPSYCRIGVGRLKVPPALWASFGNVCLSHVTLPGLLVRDAIRVSARSRFAILAWGMV